jgi:glycosyltransferase involved in cell wall biosynthesis
MGKSMNTLRLISNMRSLDRAVVEGVRIECLDWPGGRGLRTALRVFARSFRCDYILVNASPRDLLLLSLLKMLVPFNRCRLVAIDILLSRPRGRVERLKSFVRSILLRRVHRVILYYTQTEQLQKHFRLPAHKFAHIPFKINRHDLVTSAVPTDGGYIFCGGKTRRDFDTFIKAVERLPHPVKIVTTPNRDITRHGSYLDDRPRAANIETVRLDGSAEPFISLMAASRLVVLPIKPDITGAGIGVYIMAMALGKTVVISAGPSTEGLLSDDLAVVVPPEDPDALREAIDRVYRDEELRQRIGERARRYALALGDEQRLLNSVAEWLWRDLSGSQPARQFEPGTTPSTTSGNDSRETRTLSIGAEN